MGGTIVILLVTETTAVLTTVRRRTMEVTTPTTTRTITVMMITPTTVVIIGTGIGTGTTMVAVPVVETQLLMFLTILLFGILISRTILVMLEMFLVDPEEILDQLETETYQMIMEGLVSLQTTYMARFVTNQPIRSLWLILYRLSSKTTWQVKTSLRAVPVFSSAILPLVVKLQRSAPLFQ